MARRVSRKRAKKKPQINTTPFYIILVVVFVAYFIFQGNAVLAIILGALIFFLIIAILAMEISNGFREEGFTKNVIEIVIAVVAVLLIWLLLRFILNTAYPIDVVPSCSMLPALQRGDMIILQGVNQNNIKAPIVNVSESNWTKSFSNLDTEALQCVAYQQEGNGAKISQFVLPNYAIGLLESTPQGSEIVPPALQANNLIRYTCGVANVKFSNGTVEQEATTTAIIIGNTTITGDRNNSIVVYQTAPQDDFYKLGDSYIVHRAYAIVNVSGTYYVLTKGDNNPGLDIQYLNTPPNLSQIGGKVVGSIPFIGYVKLILSNNFIEPTGCNYTTES